MITSYVSRLFKITIAHHTGYKTSIFPCDLQVDCRAQSIIKIALVIVRGAILWNNLPCDMREVEFPEAVLTPSERILIRNGIRAKQPFI